MPWPPIMPTEFPPLRIMSGNHFRFYYWLPLQINPWSRSGYSIMFWTIKLIKLYELSCYIINFAFHCCSTVQSKSPTFRREFEHGLSANKVILAISYAQLSLLWNIDNTMQRFKLAFTLVLWCIITTRYDTNTSTAINKCMKLFALIGSVVLWNGGLP